jgi:hypothetical protein
MIEEHKIGVRRSHNAGDLIELALSNKSRCVGLWPPLDQGRGDLSACTSSQLLKFDQRSLKVQVDNIGRT